MRRLLSLSMVVITALNFGVKATENQDKVLSLYWLLIGLVLVLIDNRVVMKHSSATESDLLMILTLF